MTDLGDVAALIARHLMPPNPLLPGVLTQDGGLVAGTPIVLVRIGDETRRAVYLPPLALQVPGNVFVARTGGAATDEYVVVATNYQVPLAPIVPDGGWGAAWGDTNWGG